MNGYTIDEPELGAETWEQNGEYYPEEPESRRRQRRPAPAAPGRPYTPPPQSPGNFVTKPELERSLNTVRADMQRNATAIRGVGTQVDALSARTRTEIAASRNDTNNKLQLLTLLPLLATSRPERIEQDVLAADGTTVLIPAGTDLATAQDSLTSILPLLLIGGGGFGQTGAPGQQQGGFDPTMMLVLVLALSRRS